MHHAVQFMMIAHVTTYQARCPQQHSVHHDLARRKHVASVNAHAMGPMAGRLSATGQDDLDFAVFRFTLGIPGFDDDLIPRVVGVLGAVLLTANHLAAGSAAGSAALVGVRPHLVVLTSLTN